MVGEWRGATQIPCTCNPVRSRRKRPTLARRRFRTAASGDGGRAGCGRARSGRAKRPRPAPTLIKCPGRRHVAQAAVWEGSFAQLFVSISPIGARAHKHAARSRARRVKPPKRLHFEPPNAPRAFPGRNPSPFGAAAPLPPPPLTRTRAPSWPAGANKLRLQLAESCSLLAGEYDESSPTTWVVLARCCCCCWCAKPRGPRKVGARTRPLGDVLTFWPAEAPRGRRCRRRRAKRLATRAAATSVAATGRRASSEKAGDATRGARKARSSERNHSFAGPELSRRHRYPTSARSSNALVAFNWQHHAGLEPSLQAEECRPRPAWQARVPAWCGRVKRAKCMPPLPPSRVDILRRPPPTWRPAHQSDGPPRFFETPTNRTMRPAWRRFINLNPPLGRSAPRPRLMNARRPSSERTVARRFGGRSAPHDRPTIANRPGGRLAKQRRAWHAPPNGRRSAAASRSVCKLHEPVWPSRWRRRGTKSFGLAVARSNSQLASCANPTRPARTTRQDVT